MLFSSPLFLFVFLPVLLGLHALVGPRFRNLLLLVASLLFYMWGEGTYVLVMLGIIAVNYGLGRWVEFGGGRFRPRQVIAVAVAVNLGLLIGFKYLNFLVDQLNVMLALVHVPQVPLAHVHLPLGISFFTFHALSYVIDVSRRQVGSGKPLDFALYMTFFPHSIAGPIVRYGDIAGQLAGRFITTAEFAEGVRRFIIGLAKKMLVANTVAVTADAIFAIPGGELTFAVAWLGVVCYTLQIYFDFSGYSDMAIGLAKLFGIDFRENFNYPVHRAIDHRVLEAMAHLTFDWFRDYLYIPLGGNRCGRVRTYANLVTVFFLCGLWHGASWTFAGWGLFHGLFLVVERMKAGRIVESLWRRPGISTRSWSLRWAGCCSGPTRSGRRGFPGGDGRIRKRHGCRVPSGTLPRRRNWSWPWRRGHWLGAGPAAPDADSRELLVSASGLFRTGLTIGLRPCGRRGPLAVAALSAMLLAAGTHNPFIYFRF